METKAQAKFIRMSPKKVRLVANLIKGLDVEEALVQLQFSKKVAKEPLIKLLKSVINNAEENNKLKRDNLFIKNIKIDGGPILRRWLPRAHGRATPLRKRSSHISIILSERVPTKPEKTKEKVKIDKEIKKDDLVKISDLDELKDLEKEDYKEVLTSTKGKVGKDTKSLKSKQGFVSKIFNRKSGEK